METSHVLSPRRVWRTLRGRAGVGHKWTAQLKEAQCRSHSNGMRLLNAAKEIVPTRETEVVLSGCKWVLTERRDDRSCVARELRTKGEGTDHALRTTPNNNSAQGYAAHDDGY